MEVVADFPAWDNEQHQHDVKNSLLISTIHTGISGPPDLGLLSPVGVGVANPPPPTSITSSSHTGCSGRDCRDSHQQGQARSVVKLETEGIAHTLQHLHEHQLQPLQLSLHVGSALDGESGEPASNEKKSQLNIRTSTRADHCEGCRCVIDVSSPSTLERDFYAWLKGGEEDELFTSSGFAPFITNSDSLSDYNLAASAHSPFRFASSTSSMTPANLLVMAPNSEYFVGATSAGALVAFNADGSTAQSSNASPNSSSANTSVVEWGGGGIGPVTPSSTTSSSGGSTGAPRYGAFTPLLATHQSNCYAVDPLRRHGNASSCSHHRQQPFPHQTSFAHHTLHDAQQQMPATTLVFGNHPSQTPSSLSQVVANTSSSPAGIQSSIPMSAMMGISTLANSGDGTIGRESIIGGGGGADAIGEQPTEQRPKGSRRRRTVDKGRGTNLYGRPYCPGRPLSMEERARIIHLFHAGMKVNAISKQLRISHGCVSKIITRFRETGMLQPSSHSECRRRKRQQALQQQQQTIANKVENS